MRSSSASSSVKRAFVVLVISPPQSGLPFLTEKYGWFVYIVHYAFLVLTCLTLSYIAPIITAIKEKKAAKTEVLPETETVSG